MTVVTEPSMEDSNAKWGDETVVLILKTAP